MPYHLFIFSFLRKKTAYFCSLNPDVRRERDEIAMPLLMITAAGDEEEVN
jgi:hypothetical protein